MSNPVSMNNVYHAYVGGQPLQAASSDPFEANVEQAQQVFSQARTAAYHTHPKGTWGLNIALVNAQTVYKNHMNQLRSHYGRPLQLVPLALDNCEDSFPDSQFKVLDYCAQLIRSEVFSDFDSVALHNDRGLDSGVAGQTWVLHPTFDDIHDAPFTEQQAQVSLRSSMSLEGKIAVLIHEVTSHLVPGMRAAEAGEPNPPEEAGHFNNLSATSDYHRAMVTLERHWETVKTYAEQLGEEADWDEVKNDYLDDIGIQMNGYLSHLQLDSDQIDDLSEQFRNGQVNTAQFPPQVLAGLKVNLFWGAIRSAVLDETPLADIR